jgi:hypothetical protein
MQNWLPWQLKEKLLNIFFKKTQKAIDLRYLAMEHLLVSTKFVQIKTLGLRLAARGH